MFKKSSNFIGERIFIPLKTTIFKIMYIILGFNLAAKTVRLRHKNQSMQRVIQLNFCENRTRHVIAFYETRAELLSVKRGATYSYHHTREV